MAKGADLVAQPCAPDQKPDQHAGDQRQKNRDVERCRAAKAKPAREIGRAWQMGRGREACAFRRHRPFHAEDIDEQIDQKRRGDVVEHDRRDHDMATALGLQIGRYSGPKGREKHGKAHRGGKREGPMRPIHSQQDHRDAQAAKGRLPLTPDIEQPRVKGHCDGQPREDEIRGVIKRIAPAIGRAESALDHHLHRPPRAFADDRHDQA